MKLAGVLLQLDKMLDQQKKTLEAQARTVVLIEDITNTLRRLTITEGN